MTIIFFTSNAVYANWIFRGPVEVDSSYCTGGGSPGPCYKMQTCDDDGCGSCDDESNWSVVP
jgi:hypothetical protein